MKVEAHIKSLLEDCSNYELSEADTKLAEKDIQEFIKGKFASKKFRKWKLTSEAKERLEKAVKIAVENNEPVKIIFPQGGYKLWRFPSTPEVDWAEFFNISYMISYVAPLLVAYDPGVEISYYMHTLVPEKHDNLTTEEIDAYVDSFQKLIDNFMKFTPDNLSIKISKDADFYESREEYFETLDSHLDKGKEIYDDYDDAKRESKLATSKMNLKLEGQEDLTELSESELEEKIKLGAYYENSISFLEEPREFTKAEDKVLVFCVSAGDFIGIGSTKSSIAKYWVGYGVLESSGEKFRQVVLTPQQFELVSDIDYEEVNISGIDLKNLKTIRVYDSLPNFSIQ